MTSARIGTVLLLSAGVALAQQRTVSFRAGTIHLLQGRASIDGKRVILNRRGAPPVQMRAGQRLHVDRGRVELLLGPGAAVTMTDGSTLRMQQNLLSDVQLVLEQGSALVKVDQIFDGGRLRMIVPQGAVEMAHTGWFHFDASPLRLRVYRGNAEVELDGAALRAKKGDAVDLSGLTGNLSRFDLKTPDPLIAWENQRNQEAMARDRRAAEAKALFRARHTIQLDEQEQFNLDGPQLNSKPPVPSVPTPASSRPAQ